MKCLDIKIGTPTGNGKSFWRTIGTVFVADECDVCGQHGKPATFCIDFPKANGIIVPRKDKEETGTENESESECPI